MAHSAQAYPSNIRNSYGLNPLMYNDLSQQMSFELLGKRTLHATLYQEAVKRMRYDSSNCIKQGLESLSNTLPILNCDIPSITHYPGDDKRYMEAIPMYQKSMHLMTSSFDYNQQSSVSDQMKSFYSSQMKCTSFDSDEMKEGYAKTNKEFCMDEQGWFMNVKTETSDDRSNSELISQTKEDSSFSSVKLNEAKKKDAKKRVGRPKKNTAEAKVMSKSNKCLKRILDEESLNEILSNESKDEDLVSNSDVPEPTLVEYTRQFPDWDLETIFRFLRSSKSQSQFQKDKEARIIRACVGAQKKNKNSLRVI